MSESTWSVPRSSCLGILGVPLTERVRVSGFTGGFGGYGSFAGL